MGSAMVTDKMGSPPQNGGGDEGRESRIGNRETEKVDVDEFELLSHRRLSGGRERARARDEFSGVRGCLKQRPHPLKSGSPNTTTPGKSIMIKKLLLLNINLFIKKLII
jgi:hypothetical protein